MDKDKLSTKSVRLPFFDGIMKLFQMWWFWFLAYASVYGFSQSVQHTVNPDLSVMEAEEINKSDRWAAVAAKKAKKANAIAMASFTMAFTSELLIDMVYVAMITDWLS
eukprot:8845244-Ditylum_brightwellii.AAC.1